jgi:antitoxin (DNA-binding transcriptional repressor) of toxin-antitoxin stability system
VATVGIRELKAHLSHYVRLAREGERVIVTDRGEEVAELRAVTPVHPGLRKLIDSGMVKWSGGKPGPLPGPIKIRGGPISDTVLKLRERDDPLP